MHKKNGLLFMTLISDNIFFVLLLCCQDKRILADFEAHFLEFKYASNRLVTFVIFARAADLFVYGNSNPHSYMTDDDIVRRARKCTTPPPPHP